MKRPTAYALLIKRLMQNNIVPDETATFRHKRNSGRILKYRKVFYVPICVYIIHTRQENASYQLQRKKHGSSEPLKERQTLAVVKDSIYINICRVMSRGDPTYTLVYYLYSLISIALLSFEMRKGKKNKHKYDRIFYTNYCLYLLLIVVLSCFSVAKCQLLFDIRSITINIGSSETKKHISHLHSQAQRGPPNAWKKNRGLLPLGTSYKHRPRHVQRRCNRSLLRNYLRNINLNLTIFFMLSEMSNLIVRFQRQEESEH